MRDRAAFVLAIAGAALCWSALALQFVLLVAQIEASGGTLLFAVWRFLGYFTILTNLLVAVVLTRAALRRDREAEARIELMATASIAMVGLVYALLLRGLVSPEGLSKLADVMLHDLSPLVAVAYFLARRRRRLPLADALAALIFPLFYVVYALARGRFDGWYAYWFLDPRKLEGAQLALNIGGLAVAFLVMSLALRFVSNRSA